MVAGDFFVDMTASYIIGAVCTQTLSSQVKPNGFSSCSLGKINRKFILLSLVCRFFISSRTRQLQ